MFVGMPGQFMLDYFVSFLLAWVVNAHLKQWTKRVVRTCQMINHVGPKNLSRTAANRARNMRRGFISGASHAPQGSG